MTRCPAPNQLHLATIACPHGSMSGPLTARTPGPAPTYQVGTYGRLRGTYARLRGTVAAAHRAPRTGTEYRYASVSNRLAATSGTPAVMTAGDQPIVTQSRISPSTTTRSQS